MPRWPQLSKPFASFAKVPTRDPEILPCYWLYVVRNLYLQSKYTHISIHTRSHATGKIILVSCTHTFQKLILHLFSPPQMFYINQGRKWKVCLYLHQGTYHQLQENIVFFESIFDMNFSWLACTYFSQVIRFIAIYFIYLIQGIMTYQINKTQMNNHLYIKSCYIIKNMNKSSLSYKQLYK